MKFHSIVIILFTLLLLPACASNSANLMPDGQTGIRVSIGTGQSRVKGEDTNPQPVPGETKATGDGSVHAVRVEVYDRVSEDFPNISVGLRGQASLRDVTAGGFGDGTGRLDLEAQGYELHGVLRAYEPVTSWLRPFVEIHGGFGYYQGDLTASGSGLTEPVSDSDNTFDPVGGAGLGVEFDLGEKASMFIQGDYSIRLSEMKGLEFDAQDIMVFVGGEVRF